MDKLGPKVDECILFWNKRGCQCQKQAKVHLSRHLEHPLALKSGCIALF